MPQIPATAYATNTILCISHFWICPNVLLAVRWEQQSLFWFRSKDVVQDECEIVRHFFIYIILFSCCCVAQYSHSIQCNSLSHTVLTHGLTICTFKTPLHHIFRVKSPLDIFIPTSSCPIVLSQVFCTEIKWTMPYICLFLGTYSQNSYSFLLCILLLHLLILDCRNFNHSAEHYTRICHD
jgi:hypothetical protein